MPEEKQIQDTGVKKTNKQPNNNNKKNKPQKQTPKTQQLYKKNATFIFKCCKKPHINFYNASM